MCEDKIISKDYKIGETYFIDVTKPELRKSIDLAIKIHNNASAPYSHFFVGCVLIDRLGNAYTGVNNETIHYKGLCAEASAIANWVTHGNREEIICVITAGEPEPQVGKPSSTDFVTPCGDCRQRLLEYFAPNTPVFCLNQTFDKFLYVDLITLLPYAYYPDYVKKSE